MQTAIIDIDEFENVTREFKVGFTTICASQFHAFHWLSHSWCLFIVCRRRRRRRCFQCQKWIRDGGGDNKRRVGE